MREFALAPYYHPTTVCFVDDNEAFMKSLELSLPRNWATRMFTDPAAALAFLETPAELPPLMERCFSMMRRSGSEAIVRLDLNLIEQEINRCDRFQRISVVVVDYAMPLMDGLQFCAALSDKHQRKAMLTGIADEKTAVEAFNAGLIHRFIPKQTDNAAGMVIDFVDDLRQEYFAQYSAQLQNTLAIDPPAFLTDPVVAAFVADLMEREGLVEYYLVDDPSGLMLLKSNGRIWRLVILTAAEQTAQLQSAIRNNAPEDILRQFRERRIIACFDGDPPENYFGSEPYPWAETVTAASTLTGVERTYYVGILPDAPPDIDFDPARTSYDAYLATL